MGVFLEFYKRCEGIFGIFYKMWRYDTFGQSRSSVHNMERNHCSILLSQAKSHIHILQIRCKRWRCLKYHYISGYGVSYGLNPEIIFLIGYFYQTVPNLKNCETMMCRVGEVVLIAEKNYK